MGRPGVAGGPARPAGWRLRPSREHPQAGPARPAAWLPPEPSFPVAPPAAKAVQPPAARGGTRRPPAPPTRADPVLPWADSLPTRVDIAKVKSPDPVPSWLEDVDDGRRPAHPARGARARRHGRRARRRRCLGHRDGRRASRCLASGGTGRRPPPPLPVPGRTPLGRQAWRVPATRARLQAMTSPWPPQAVRPRAARRRPAKAASVTTRKPAPPAALTTPRPGPTTPRPGSTTPGPTTSTARAPATMTLARVTPRTTRCRVPRRRTPGRPTTVRARPRR